MSVMNKVVRTIYPDKVTVSVAGGLFALLSGVSYMIGFPVPGASAPLPWYYLAGETSEISGSYLMSYEFFYPGLLLNIIILYAASVAGVYTYRRWQQ